MFEKVEEFWKTNYIEIVPPVEGAPEGIKKLRELGFRLIVVTARQRREMDRGKTWLEEHFPGMFDGMICTGQSQETLGESHEALTKLSKAGVSTFHYFRYSRSLIHTFAGMSQVRC